MLGEPIWRNPALYFRIGFCPEQDAFYERMTGLEWVRALVRLNGVDERAGGARWRAARSRSVDLRTPADKKIGAYSKGMRQRVKLAQALAHDPELLILDEPLAGMDPLARRKTIRMIKEWGRAGKSVIVSSHILHEIESMTSNILLINQGRILAEGNVHQIRDLIDEHPHTVYIKADAAARRSRASSSRHDDVLSLRFEDEAVVVQTGAPRCVLCTPDRRSPASGEHRRHSRGHVARRQPPGRLPVSGEVMTEPASRDPDAALLASAAARLRHLARPDAVVAPIGLSRRPGRRPGRARRR